MTTQNTTPEAQGAAAAASANAAAALPEDDFDAVFAEITKDTSDATPAAAKPAADAAGADDAAGGDAVASDSPDAAVAAAEAAAAGANAPAAAGAEPTDAEKLAAAQARVAELEAAVAKPKDDAKPAAETPAAAAPAKEPEIQWYKPTEEEAAALTAYEKEWPEISAAESIRTKAAVYNAVQYALARVATLYGPAMERFAQVSDEVESFMALSELRGAHNDYDTIRENVVQWAGTLPGPFKKAAQETMKTGTPEEVSELIAEYKKANPTKPVVVAPAVAAPAAKGKTEGISAAAKKAAVALTAVDSKRTSQQAAADPNDFDGAWAEATAKG